MDERFDQAEYELKCERGLQGLLARAEVFPYRWKDSSAQELARGHEAAVGQRRDSGGDADRAAVSEWGDAGGG